MRIEATVLVALSVGTLASRVDAQEEDYSYEYQDRVRVESTRDEVMSRPEFERLRTPEEVSAENPAWLDRLLDWIESWLTGSDDDAELSPGGSGGALVYGVAVVIVLAVLVFIVGSILRAAEERNLSEEGDPATIVRTGAAPGETPPDELWAHAQSLAADGNYRDGIRQLLLAAMSTLERTGRIRHRKGLTNRDYFWAAAADARDGFSVIIQTFERVYFGRREATAQGFEACAAAYRDGFRGDRDEPQ